MYCIGIGYSEHLLLHRRYHDLFIPNHPITYDFHSFYLIISYVIMSLSQSINVYIHTIPLTCPPLSFLPSPQMPKFWEARSGGSESGILKSWTRGCWDLHAGGVGHSWGRSRVCFFFVRGVFRHRVQRVFFWRGMKLTWNLEITPLIRKIMSTKPPWLWVPAFRSSRGSVVFVWVPRTASKLPNVIVTLFLLMLHHATCGVCL